MIVVDDGSTDGSGEVVEQIRSAESSGRVLRQVFRSEESGASAARNTRNQRSAGEYIGFLDSDDIWLPEKLEWQIKALDQFKNQCAACVTDARLVNQRGPRSKRFETQGRHYPQTIGIDRDATKSLAQSFCFGYLPCWSGRTRFGRLEASTRRSPSSKTATYFFRLSLVTSIAYVNKLLIQTDRTPSPTGSICRPWDNKEFQFRHQQQMLESWLAIGIRLIPEVRKIVEQALGSLHSHCANWHLENSRYAEARHSVASAVRYRLESEPSENFSSLGSFHRWRAGSRRKLGRLEPVDMPPEAREPDSWLESRTRRLRMSRLVSRGPGTDHAQSHSWTKPSLEDDSSSNEFA